MVPSLFVPIDMLPYTASGKIDRRALPEPETVARRQVDFVAPDGPLEERLSAMWMDVLGVDRVGATDDFFELGGHSLLAAQVIARLRSLLGVELPLHAIFVAPTVRKLAEQIMQLTQTGSGDSEMSELLTELESLTDEDAATALAEEAATRRDQAV
jgi:acyl carrier protein